LTSSPYVNPPAWLNDYLRQRASSASQHSDFQCDPACSRPGCKNPDLQIPVSVVDLLGASHYLNEPVSAIYRRYHTLGLFTNDRDDWLRTVTVRLKKPCPFLKDDLCGLYPVRPLPCMLFPEYLVSRGTFAAHAAKDQFRDYLCLREPLQISPERANVVRKMRTRFERELLLSSYYLFNDGLCHIDFSNLIEELSPAGENAGSAKPDELAEPQRFLTNQDLEQFFRERLAKLSPFDGADDKIGHLDTPEGQETFFKLWQDELLLKKLRQYGDDRALVFQFVKGKLKARRRGIIPAEYKFSW